MRRNDLSLYLLQHIFYIPRTESSLHDSTLPHTWVVSRYQRTLLVSQRVKIQLLPIHSKHMGLWPSGCTELGSKILERGIIVNILKSSLKFSMEKLCTASGEDILFNNVNLATLKLWYICEYQRVNGYLDKFLLHRAYKVLLQIF